MIFVEIALYFGLLSLLAFGGMSAVMPELHRIVVDVNGWVDPHEFMQLFAIAQAAPGPNVLISSLVGWKVAGFAGSVLALLATCAPAAAIALWVSALWDRFRESPWRAIISRALAPMVVGLTLAGGYVVATPESPDWRLWLIAGLTAAGVLKTKLNPLWFIAMGGVLGAVLL